MRKIMTFVFSLFIWYLLTWPYNFQKNSMDWQIFIAGIFVSLLATIILKDVFITRKHKRIFFVRMFWWFLYLPVFFYYMLLANLDVLYRVVHPKMPIRPGIIKLKTKLKTDTSRTTLANSITLTPGTLTVDITDDGYLYIHCIFIKKLDKEKLTFEIIRRFENILEKVYE